MNAFSPYLAEALASFQAIPETPALGPLGQDEPPAPAEMSAMPAGPPAPLASQMPPTATHGDPFAAGATAAGITPKSPFDATPPTAPPLNPFGQPFNGLDAPIKAPAMPPMGPAGFSPEPTANTNALPAGPGPAANVNAPGDFPLAAVPGGGVIPAHEVDVRGPSLKSAQGAANDASSGAIQNVDQRSEHAAQAEYGMALDQERQARLREAAWQQSVAERDEEMQQHQADFDQSVKALSQTAIDPNRFWSSRSTGQKVSAMVSLALGGFLQGARGGSNPGMDVLNTAIDRDVRAQEAQFQAARDVVGARQTAFSLAAQKYQNLDAARSMARAAAIDAVQAQMAQNAALWHGTDAANRADVAMAQLQQEKMAQIANGVRFILPQAAPRMFVDPKTGLRYTEQEAKGMAHELRGYEQDREKQGLQTAGQILAKRAEQEGERQIGGGMGKAGAEKMALEAAQAQQERDANLKAINNAMENLPAVVKGGYLGTIAAKSLPAGAPGVTDATNDMNARESYNNRAMLAVAAAYKLSTDATEPKNLTILEHYSGPYVVKPGDNEEVARSKMQSLKKLVSESAAAKGPTPAGPAKLPASFTAHGGK